jgi:hypothetical protein
MSKSHHNDGPTFRPGTMKVPRRPAPSLERQRVALDQIADECAVTREFNELPEADRISTLVGLALARKK